MSVDVPNSFPADRTPIKPLSDTFSNCPQLASAWDATAQVIQKLRDAIDPTSVACVAASGSIGRMEKSQRSDCDLILLVDDDDGESDVAQQVWNTLKEQRLRIPRPTGIYATASSERELCDDLSLGQIDESPCVFGKRIQLLLDSQPILGEDKFETIQAAIVARYSVDPTESEDRVNWRFLINDLIRYFRSLAVHYQWSVRDEPGRWRLRNVKFRFSRLVNYAGLLLLLGSSTVLASNPIPWLCATLKMAPLERIAWVYAQSNDVGFHQIASVYDRYLTLMEDSYVRDELKSAELDQHQIPIKNSSYREMMERSTQLTRELQRFLDARRDDWPSWFHDSLFF